MCLCSTTFVVDVFASGSVWNSSLVTYSSGRSDITQGACACAQASECVPFLLSLQLGEGGQDNTSVAHTDNATLVLVTMAVPPAVLSQLSGPTSTVVLRATESLCDASVNITAPACTSGSSASDFNGTHINTALCASGGFTVQVQQAANTAPVAAPHDAGVDALKLSAIVLGSALVAVVAGCFVYNGAKRMMRPASLNKIVPAAPTQTAVPSLVNPTAAKPLVRQPQRVPLPPDRPPRPSKASERRGPDRTPSRVSEPGTVGTPGAVEVSVPGAVMELAMQGPTLAVELGRTASQRSQRTVWAASPSPTLHSLASRNSLPPAPLPSGQSFRSAAASASARRLTVGSRGSAGGQNPDSIVMSIWDDLSDAESAVEAVLKATEE